MLFLTILLFASSLILAGFLFFFLKKQKHTGKYIQLLLQKNSIYQNQETLLHNKATSGEGNSEAIKITASEIFSFLKTSGYNIHRLSVWSLNHKKFKLLSMISPIISDFKEGESINMDQVISWEKILKGEYITINSNTQFNVTNILEKELINTGMRSSITIPLSSRGEINGFIKISSEEENTFKRVEITNDLQELTSSIALLVKLYLDKELLNEKLDSLNRKNKKAWEMSISVHKQKEEIDEKLIQIRDEYIKLEKEKEKIKQRNNKLWENSMSIHKEKEKVEKIKLIIEEKHQSLTDSLSYAKRIQEAIMPSLNILKESFSDSFILFMPRDIVSGDFFWALKTENDDFIWAAADCTGHGVPGAFMSMIGISLLNKTVLENGITSPEKILDNIRAGIIAALSQKDLKEDDMQHDGMDIALCLYRKNEQKVYYAGANNPLWLIKKNGELVAFTPNKQPVGYFPWPKNFTVKEFNVEPGDTIYTFSDGFADQFGGPKGKKYMYGPLKKFLLSINSSTMARQNELLKESFINWKGTMDQIDDVCVIGVRI